MKPQAVTVNITADTRQLEEALEDMTRRRIRRQRRAVITGAALGTLLAHVVYTVATVLL